jgi:cytochrome c oxidase subunit 2
MRHFITFLTIQTSAAVISLIAGAVVVLVVIYLLAAVSPAEDKVAAKHKVYKIRAKYFFVLVACVIAGLIITLGFLPYPKFQHQPDATVTVVGMQWAWKFAAGVSDEQPLDMKGESEITLPPHKLIRFLVTSSDVNHDFAIYNTKGVLVAQTQAMPGYHNALEYEFSQAGDYHILCLEYCGIAHAIMVGTIHVK